MENAMAIMAREIHAEFEDGTTAQFRIEGGAAPQTDATYLFIFPDGSQKEARVWEADAGTETPSTVSFDPSSGRFHVLT